MMKKQRRIDMRIISRFIRVAPARSMFFLACLLISIGVHMSTGKAESYLFIIVVAFILLALCSWDPEIK